MPKIAHRRHARKVKIIAVLAAATIFASGWTLSKYSHKFFSDPEPSYVPDEKELVIEEEEEEKEEVIAEVNDFEKIEEKLINFIEDASERGLGDLETEDLLALYILLNIEQISPSQAAYLYDDRFNAEILMDKATQAMNVIASDAMYSKPGDYIDVSSLVVDEKATAAIVKFQEIFARYNVANQEEKMDIARIMLNEIEDLYATAQWKSLPDGVSMLIQSKIWFVYHDLLNDQAIFNRYGNKMESLELILFANQTNCLEDKDARYNPNIASRYSDNSIDAKKKLTVKYDQQMQLYARENEVLTRFSELIAQVDEKANPIYVARPTIEEKSMADKEAKMEETVVVTPAPSKPEETTQPPLTFEEIEEHNIDEEIRAQAVVDGFEAGNRDAIRDTSDENFLSRSEPFPSRNERSHSSQYSNKQVYQVAYSNSYLKSYSETIIEQAAVYGKHHGLSHGVRLVEQDRSFSSTNTIIHSLYQKFNGTMFENAYLRAFNNAARVSYEETLQAMREAEKEHGDGVKPPTVIEESPTETIIILPGYSVD